MKRAASSLFGSQGCVVVLAVAVATVSACNGFGTIGAGKRLLVTVTQGDPGTPDQPRPISVATPAVFTVDIEAHLADGSLDTAFNGFVNISVQPGTVQDLNVRNVALQNGVLRGVVVPTVAVFGEAHIWADDLGYEPADPNRQPPPQCSDGKDNNGNGLIDFPADPGCFAPVDDSEDLGTYASGASDTLYFQLPRIALVRGYDPQNGGNGNATAFPHTQVHIDTGYRPQAGSFVFSTVVIGLTSAGFYAQDLQTDLAAPAPGYGGIFAYNFSTPPFMRVCDRLQILSGEASDFYGFTELNYPTWQLEYWDQNARPCLVPEPINLGVCDLVNPNTLWQNEATLVRVETVGSVNVHVAQHFGAGDVPIVAGAYVPDVDKSNCDYDHNGKINYADAGSMPSEADCAAACSGTSSAAPLDPECSEYSQFLSQNDFELVVSDPTSEGGRCPPLTQARLQVTAAAANLFDPQAERGTTLRSFAGLLSYFSGGTQFTAQARCDDDIVTDLTKDPLTSSRACVHPRKPSELNQSAP
jgi:hypothetical protein